MPLGCGDSSGSGSGSGSGCHEGKSRKATAGHEALGPFLTAHIYRSCEMCPKHEQRSGLVRNAFIFVLTILMTFVQLL
jgi:hypothetical protein